MRLSRPAALAVALLAWCALAATAGAQQGADAEAELRLPDPASAQGRTAGPVTVLATPASLLDPLLATAGTARIDALRAIRAAGFVGGFSRTYAGVAGRAPLRAWAVRLESAADAAGLRGTVQRALTARSAAGASTALTVAGAPGGRGFDVTGADGVRLVVAVFPAGPWLYGIEAVTGADGAAPDPAEVAGLAALLAARHPEAAGTTARPLEVTDAVVTELAQARAAARAGRAQAAPRAGTVQAARHLGRDVAIASFPGGSEPELFHRDGPGAWRWVGDVGGPGCPRLATEVRAVWGLATACPAQTSVVATAGGTGLEADASPLHGIGMWVWEVPKSGGTSGIIARARKYGFRTVYIKSGDGVNYWRQFDRSVRQLKAAGLKVCGWQYVRGRRPAPEARVGARAIARGADCFVVNAEIEFERMGIGRSSRAHRNARAYMAELRRRGGNRVPIGFTSFAYPDLHARFPYSAFLTGPDAADVNMPQIYWGAFRSSVDTAVRRAAPWNALYGVPVAPIGGTYVREKPADLRRFRCLAAGYGWAGVSYWSLQHTRANQWTSLSNLAACNTPAPTPTAREYPELKPGRRGDQALLAQDRLFAWGYPVTRDGDYGPRTRTAVATFQRDRGLQATGVVTPTTWALLLSAPPA